MMTDRLRRTWWVLPYCAGALAVFLVAGLVIGLRHTSGTAPATNPASSAAPMPAEMFPDPLFGQLTESRRLDLVETTPFPSGVVVHVYRPQHS